MPWASVKAGSAMEGGTMRNLDRRFDALVIGSGPAGSTAVKELTEAGMEVVLLEAGRDTTETDFLPPAGQKRAKSMDMSLGDRARAMLHGQFNQARRAFFSPTTGRFLVNDWENPYTYPLNSPYLWIRSRILGGRMHAYGRVLQRMSDVDFRAASRDGFGQDWPFLYSDLEPFYDRVEEFLGVYGDKDGLAHPPDNKYVGPGFLTQMEQDFKRQVEAEWPDRHVISWRYQAPFLDRIPPGIAAARKTGRLTTRTDAVVTRITVDPRTGLANGAVFVDRVTKREYHVVADVVVLCASAIESIRLLLHSGSTRHPDGLANSSGLLGRYFMEQTLSLAYCDAPQWSGFWESDSTAPRDPFYGASGGILIPRYQNLGPEPTEEYRRGFSFQGLGGRVPVPEGAPAMFGLGAGGEMLPRYDNHVGLSRVVKDKWGVPAAHIVCRPDENDRKLVTAAVDALREMIGLVGYRVNFVASQFGLHKQKVWPDFNVLQRAVFRVGIRTSIMMGTSIHECGGARVGHDPAASVLNGVNQSWDVPNLFVTDSASFPSASTVGPALTIMAVTARACRFIAEAHASGELARPTQAASL